MPAVAVPVCCLSDMDSKTILTVAVAVLAGSVDGAFCLFQKIDIAATARSELSMKKKNTAIVLGATKNYFFAIGSLVLNIKKILPDFADDILIYYDEIADRDQAILVDELGCTLLPYDCSFGTHLESTATMHRFTLLSFSIYEIFKHLDEYRHVLWLDGDICIQGDISDIIRYGPVGMRYGGSQFSAALGRSVYPPWDERPTNNTGVVLVTDALTDYHSLREQCYYYTKKFSDTLVLPDQAIFNYVLWKNKIAITNLTDTYNYTVHHSMNSFSKAKIFHLACECKFWNHPVLRNLFPVWEECYQQWLAMGGSAYTGRQLYYEFGNHFSMLNMLNAIQPDARLMQLIDEQQRTIEQLTRNVEDLLGVIQGRKQDAKSESLRSC